MNRLRKKSGKQFHLQFKKQKKKKKKKKKPRYKLNQGGDLYNENDKTLKKISEYGKTSHVHELEELIL
jgi:hypothetical protein